MEEPDDLTRKPRSSGHTRAADVILRLAVPTALTYLLLIAVSLVPVVDSTRGPFIDLTSTLAEIAYWVAESGGTRGAPIVIVAALFVLISRPGIGGRRRLVEGLAILTLVGIGAGGGAAINEHGVKARLRIPRPNIVQLAGLQGDGPLGRTPEQFYGLGDKDLRGDSLRVVLVATPAPVELSPSILEHWVQETGYSFPSGHTFSSMFIAVFFLAAGLAYLSPARARLLYVLMPWALLVGLSRPLLRVHTPADLAAGGGEGVVVGVIAFLALDAVVRRWAPAEGA